MRKKSESVSYLRIVKTPANDKPASTAAKINASSKKKKRRTKVQQELFPNSYPFLIAFIAMSLQEGPKFRKLLHSIRPRWVFDLRVIPRFDVRGLNRRLVFDMFSELACSYQDLAGLLGISSRQDTRLNPYLIGDTLAGVLRESGESKGPIAILVEEQSGAYEYSAVVPWRLPSSKRAWEVLVS